MTTVKLANQPATAALRIVQGHIGPWHVEASTGTNAGGWAEESITACHRRFVPRFVDARPDRIVPPWVCGEGADEVNQ